MGNCLTVNKDTISKLAFEPKFNKSEHYVINFISATNVPQADLTSPSDPYLKACIYTEGENHTKKRITKIHETLIKNDNPNPCWNSFFDFQVNPPANSFLKVEIYDFDNFNEHDLLGIIDVPLSKLTTEDIQTIVVGNNSKFTISLKRILPGPNGFPNEKTFFIIRHGESKWNLAQSKMNLTGMINYDHSLTLKGIEQAKSVNASWKEAKSSGLKGNSDTKKYVDLFINATQVYASPLTRASQTALFVMEDHPALNKGLTLYR